MKNPMSLFKKCRKGTAVWIICAGVCLSVLNGCHKRYTYNYYEENVTPETPDKVTLSLSVEDLVFEAKGGWQEFTIDCSGEWTVTGGNEWCLPGMVSGSGKAQMKVMVEAYTGTDDRNVILTIKAGELTQTLTVTQKSVNALILTKDKIEVPAEGNDISVEVKTNVECTPIVPSAFQTWIKESPVSKAMETKNFRFTVTANKDSLQREGYIVIDGGELKDTVHIQQAAIRSDTDITDKFDPNFAQFLQEKGYIKNTNHITAGDVNKINRVDVSNKKDLTSLQGIEYLTELTDLVCDENNLNSLDVSNNTKLTTLSCRNNKLSSLDISKNTELTTLWCGCNNLSSLEVSKNTKLRTLRCYSNNLSSLEVSKNTELTNLECGGNNLSSLDVSKNTKLTYLQCNSNNLSSLDINNNTKLTELECAYNNLSSLDISKNTELTYLACSNNNLSSLEVSKNTELTRLDCDNNNLSSLDVSKNTKLTSLQCSSNNLSSFEVSKNTELTDLWCDRNNLSSLEVSKNTKLTGLACFDNNLSSLDISKNTELTLLWCYHNPGTGETFPLTVWTTGKPTQLEILRTSWNYNDKEVTIEYITKQ